MKNRTTIMIVMVLFFTVLFIIQGDGNPTESRKNRNQEKVYVVYTIEENLGCAVENVSREPLFNIPCIKGTQVGQNWFEDTIVYIPIDKISTIIEFESLQSYKYKLREYELREEREEELRLDLMQKVFQENTK